MKIAANGDNCVILLAKLGHRSKFWGETEKFVNLFEKCFKNFLIGELCDEFGKRRLNGSKLPK